MTDAGGRCKSDLVEGAGVGRAASDGAPSQGRAVLGAMESWAARRREVAGVGTAAAAEDAQRVADGAVESLHLVVTEVLREASRVDTGAPQDLVAQEVAEAGDARLVHEHGLH